MKTASRILERAVQQRGVRAGLPAGGPASSVLGFTLLELLVVLMIAVGIAALALPKLSNAIGLFELKSGARQMASALQTARGRAIAQDGEVAVIVDVEKRTYQLTGSGETRPVSPEITLKLETADVEVLSDQVAAIRFFADGSSTGGRLTLAASGQRYVISVDWLTGRVRVHE